MEEKYDLEPVPMGVCPHCGEDYGVLRDNISGQVLNEYSNCMCAFEELTKKKQKVEAA